MHVRLDYSSKCFDLRKGLITGILAGLASLDCSKLVLMELRLENLAGGAPRLAAEVVKIWTEDIKNNQVKEERDILYVILLHKEFQISDKIHVNDICFHIVLEKLDF